MMNKELEKINSFYNGKKVLITGHTGFKGTWLTKILADAGAIITGYSLEPNPVGNLYTLLDIDNRINSVIGDVRDFNKLRNTFETFNPQIVFHLAAQPLVLESYNNPHYTYETNIIGTLNILECIRLQPSVKSFINVTTDKVYKNTGWVWGYREIDELDGFDPYSNSKSCSELVTGSYARSFFENRALSISTVRAGNVIGGGDFAQNRIIPDCIKSTLLNQSIVVRNPNSIRPYQHVMEPLSAYLLLALKQYDNKKYEGKYNVGPNEDDCLTTGELVAIFCKSWGDSSNWCTNSKDTFQHEANYLKLDSSKIKKELQWFPRWNINQAIDNTVKLTKVIINQGDINKEIENQIYNYYMSGTGHAD